MSRFFVTGATGFLGTHLLATLRAQGHEVVALCRKGRQPDVEGVVLRQGDVLDAASIRDAAAGCTGVFHCAGKVSRKKEDAEELYRLHVEGTKTVLSACREAGLRRAVVASTSGTVAVSDDPDKISNEGDETPMALISRWPYYRSKLFAERAALEMNAPDFEVVSVNPTLLLGPGDRQASSTEDVRLFLEGKVPAVPGGGISFVDARDAAEAMRLAMERGVAGKRYLVGACNLTLKEFFGRLARVSGVRAPWVTMPRSTEFARIGAEAAEKIAARLGFTLPIDAVSLDMAQRYWYLDATLAETELGWTSRDPMVTLKDTVEDLRARGVVWPSDEESAPKSWLASRGWNA
jgi:dihydroflavonol-4-reductase